MSKELREEHLDLLAERRATDWNLTKPQAAAVIKEAEMSRKMHKKHQYFVKYQEKGSVKNILVPCPRSEWIPQPTDITEQKCQIRVDNPIDVFNILLRQNFNHLMKSKFSPFVKGDLQEKLGVDADKKYVDSILQGLDKEKIKSDFQNNSPIFHNFIQALQIPTTINGEKVPTMKWQYGIEEYKATFSKVRETISCGPSGIHMSHWKAALQREQIMRVHSFFIWVAFQFGFSYKEWEISYHCTPALSDSGGVSYKCVKLVFLLVK